MFRGGLLALVLVACGAGPVETATPVSGSASGSSSTTTGSPTGASSGTAPAGAAPGTPTGTTSAACPAPTQPPDDLCELASGSAAFLDAYQPVDPNLVLICHSANGTNWTQTASTVAACLTHIGHANDLLPPCRC